MLVAPKAQMQKVHPSCCAFSLGYVFLLKTTMCEILPSQRSAEVL